MNPEEFRNSPAGGLAPTIGGQFAFVPNPLPPRELDLGPLVPLIARATKALGELSGIGATLPNPYLLVRPFMRTEAVASSKIEGTVTTLPELFLLEAAEGAAPARNETKEVNNYTRALQYGLGRVKDLPVSGRLIREMHQVLMEDVDAGRGAHIIPGEFKTEQNWIGARLIENARFVPPPPREALDALADLERYIHDPEPDPYPLIIRLALIHYQFETIHPFPDGNGRVGRLLIPLLLCERKEISQPLLYLSAYFEKNYNEYIDRMYLVSKEGSWEAWVEFFLKAVAASCEDAIRKASALQALYADYRQRIQTARSSALLAKLVDKLFDIPATTIPYSMKSLGVSYNAAKNNIQKLEKLGILSRDDYDGRAQWFFAKGIIRTYA